MNAEDITGAKVIPFFPKKWNLFAQNKKIRRLRRRKG
jgi:hypothetical protein